jgi:hypothetical protein
MATSARSDLGAVWLVQSRKLIAQLEFWLVLVGYDLRKHAFSSRLYVVYVIVFFSIWGFAVLTLLAGFAGQILSALPFDSPLAAAIAVGAAAIVALFLFELYIATRRSPFVFSEADSYLLALTPVDRRAVALIWFVGAWLIRSLFFWPGSIVLGYGLLEAQTVAGFTIADLPMYLLAGLRMLIMAIPLLLAAQSLAWSAGAWRLQGTRYMPALRWVAPGLAVLYIAGWIVSRAAGGAGIPIWLWPLAFPLQAGLGAAPFLAGLVVSLAWAALGLFILWSAARKMSLARASQETRSQEAMQAAILTGASGLAEEIRQRQRLGVGREPSRLPLRPGLAALVWRNTVQWQRSLTFGQILSWVGILGLTLVMLLSPDWGARAWAFVFWSILVGQQAVRYLKMDLKRWWLMRQLPFSFAKILLGDVIVPLIGLCVTGLIALLIATFLGQTIPTILVWLFLPGVAVVGMAAAVDILRTCKSERLLAGTAPDLSLLTILLAALVIGIPGWIAWLAVYRWSISLGFVLLAVLVVIASLVYALYRLAINLFRSIR